MLYFILAVAAGYATPLAMPVVTSVLDKIPGVDLEATDQDKHSLTFAALLLAVAVLAFIGGTQASAFNVVLGGVVGLFATRLFKAGKAAAQQYQAKSADKSGEK